ncbi:hypothetical protein DPMN_022721 [Dreissena polymorpha]|uniref:Uncharacterized protein n=1 Tax=Dreissena polymorpha TaxID=45954 RepID=A0A9D4NKU1_DREPO|nr:hypothetical protein DPMN_022721 [Dreissena polymorpha]
MRHVDRATACDDGQSMSINLDVHKTFTFGRYGFLYMDVHTFRLLEMYVSDYFQGRTKLETENELVFGCFENGDGTVQP